MNELVKTIDELYAAFKTDAELQAGKNNKAAGPVSYTHLTLPTIA